MALLNSPEELKAVLGGIQKNISWDTIGPYVEQAQLTHLLPVLGPEILQEVEDGIASQRTEPAFRQLLQHLARPLSYFAQLEALPFLNGRIGDMGLHEAQTTNAVPIRLWSYQQLELATARNAEVFLDAAIQYLERNAATWPVWAESEACSVHRGQLMPDAATFSRYANTQGSRRAFLAFRPYLDRAEALHVAPLVSAELIAGVKERLQAGTATAPDQAFLLRVRPALAQLALAEGILELSISMSGAGLSVLADNYAIKQRLASPQEELDRLALKARTLAERYLTELRQFLDKNVTAYPEYADSDAYNLPGEQATYQLPDNSDSVSFWV